MHNLEELNINLNNVYIGNIKFTPESAENQDMLKHLNINLNDSSARIDLYNQNIQNLKISQNSPEQTKDNLINCHMFFHNLMGCENIDFSQLKSLYYDVLNFSQISKQCKWKFPENAAIKEWKRIPDPEPLYYNQILFKKDKNLDQNKTTKELREKYFIPKTKIVQQQEKVR